MRTITDHIVERDSAPQLTIKVLDEPGAGGACHAYQVMYDIPGETGSYVAMPITFQNGPIQEAGINGITQEALLAIVIDRLRSFQAGPFACAANQNALHYAEMCLGELQARTRERLARGVEGRTIA